MRSWRITKYDPIYRDSNGVYTVEEWTSFADIGRKIGDVVLTEDDYYVCENAYISVIKQFALLNQVDIFTILSLEKGRILDSIGNEYGEYVEKLFDGEEVNIEDAIIVSRMNLREMIWCKLVSAKMRITFGYDFYMYIESEEDIGDETKKFALGMGLFVEEYENPYL